MIEGHKYNHWTVIDPTPSSKHDGYRILCKCDCGIIKKVSKKYLIGNRSKSCGCHGLYPGVMAGSSMIIEVDNVNPRTYTLKCEHGVFYKNRLCKGSPRRVSCPCTRNDFIHKKHGESSVLIRTKEYNCWRMMRQRCNDFNNKSFNLYGGRGIKVCKRWDDYSLFLSDMGRCPDRHSIDRINVNGDYEPSNCRWANVNMQQRNKRNSLWFEHENKKMHLKDWANYLGVSYQSLWQRIKRSDSFANAIQGIGH